MPHVIEFVEEYVLPKTRWSKFIGKHGKTFYVLDHQLETTTLKQAIEELEHESLVNETRKTEWKVLQLNRRRCVLGYIEGKARTHKLAREVAANIIRQDMAEIDREFARQMNEAQGYDEEQEPDITAWND